MEIQGWQMLWFVFFDPKSQSPGEAALLQHSRLAFSRYLVDSEWLAWWALWAAPWTRQPRKLLLSSHLIQHIPCLEARSTNEVGDWKMVGWVVIVILLHCCTPIWLWHALAKNSASFSSPLWFDGHFGRKETLLSGRAHLYISGVPDSESFGKSFGKIKRKPQILMVKKHLGFLQIFRNKPIHWSWWFPRPEPTPMVRRQEAQTASGHLVDVGLSSQDWSVCHHFALWTWQKLQLYHLSWD